MFMYDMIEEKLIECKLARRIDPVLMTKDGKKLSEDDDVENEAFCCKVNLKILHPEMIIVAD